MNDEVRLLEAERDLLLEQIGHLDLKIASQALEEGAWTGSMGGHDPDFLKLRGGLRRFWIEKCAKDPHPFTYCVRHLRKHVANPERLCFAPGTLVETRHRGQVAVEDIRPGEEVRTHTGEFRPVLGTRANRSMGRRMLAITTELNEKPLVVTEDHPVLVARGAAFIEGTRTRLRTKAARLAAGIDHRPRSPETMLYPSQEIGTIEDTEARGIRESDYLLYPRQRPVQDAPVSDDYLWLLGMFAAEGSWGSHTPRWCYGIEEPLAKECQERLERETGRRARIVRMPTTDHVCLDVNQRGAHKPLVESLEMGISGNVWTKRFADWVLMLPEDRLRIVIDAYWSGDGHVRPSRSEAVATTVSRDLAYQLRQALIYLGERPSMRQTREDRTEIIEGRSVHGRPTWSVSYNPNMSRRKDLGNEDYMAMPIRTIEEVEAPEWVYTLHVSEHNTLIANGTITLQCAWLKDQALGTTKWRKGNKKIGEADTQPWEPTTEELREALQAYEEAARELGIIVEGDADGDRTPPDEGREGERAPEDLGNGEPEGAEGGNPSSTDDAGPKALDGEEDGA